jgi:hypothetical protein
MILERVPQGFYDCAFSRTHWEETMPGPAPKTDKWTARENQQGKLGIVLIVSGLVQVSSANKEPILKEASGGGGYGKTLVLDLTIETGAGEGAQVLVWKRATFSTDVSADHYDNVEIRWEGKTIATVKVADDAEHLQHLTALTQAANKAQAGKAKPRPAPAKPKPRPAPKSPAPKRAAPAKPAAKKKKPAAAKKRAPTATKRKAVASKKRAAGAAKKRSGAKKRTSAGKLLSAARKWLSGAKKRPTAKKRPAAKKKRPAARKRVSRRR